MRAFEDWHVIGFAAGEHNARDGGNEHAAADSAVIGQRGGAQVMGGEAFYTLDAVPFQAAEIIFDRVIAVVLGDCFDGIGSDTDGDADVFVMQPVGGQCVVAIGPMLRLPAIIFVPEPRRWLERHG